MENVTLNVTGMTCGHCVKAVEGSVCAVNGVTEVAVSLADGQVTVVYDAAQVSVAQIKETIEEQGFDVE